jgi:hypothetical protein
MRGRAITLAFIMAAALTAGCGDADPSVVGTWEFKTGNVTNTLVLMGTASSGTVAATQSALVSGGAPTCRIETTGSGSYAVTGSTITFTLTAGREKTLGCSSPDTDMPGNNQQWMSFAMALSGAFTVSQTTLTLPNYGPFTRK